jgi:hypothetical protein
VFQVNLSHGVLSQDASCRLTLFAGIALTGLVTFLCDFLAEPTVATQVCAVVMTIERPCEDTPTWWNACNVWGDGIMDGLGTPVTGVPFVVFAAL